jgi:hypothetical protein
MICVDFSIPVKCLAQALEKIKCLTYYSDFGNYSHLTPLLEQHSALQSALRRILPV